MNVILDLFGSTLWQLEREVIKNKDNEIERWGNKCRLYTISLMSFLGQDYFNPGFVILTGLNPGLIPF